MAAELTLERPRNYDNTYIIHTGIHFWLHTTFPKLKQTLSQHITLLNYLMKIWVACQNPLKSLKKAPLDDSQLQRKPLENVCLCDQPQKQELAPWS